MLNKESALALIKKYFPDSCIYSDEYKKLNHILGMQYIELRSFCIDQGYKNVRNWLISKRMYYPIERDMRTGADVELAGIEDPVRIAKTVFTHYPLLGDAVLSEQQKIIITDYAQNVFDHIYAGWKHSPDDDIVLVLAIVLLLRKKRSTDEADESFWPYIYGQFGYVHTEAAQSIYQALCKAVSNSLNRFGRYIAPPGTQKYYTSLMLHALAPVSSMENLFEILLYFYVDELECTYIPEDPAYKAIVNCIVNRWDKEVEKDPDLHVRSNIIASGLKILFQERPVFMAQLCEGLVKKIDALVRTQGASLLKSDSYLDQLLESWYEKQAEERRAKLYQEKTQYKGVRRASAVEHVRIKYVLNEKQIAIYLPAIRLETVESQEPELLIYQGDELVSHKQLDVYGRLCWTIRQETIILNEYTAEHDNLNNLRVVILYNGQELIDTKKTLFRDYLIFDKNGNEITRQSMGRGTYFVFAPESAAVEFGDEMEPYQLDHPGQLFEVWIQDNASIRVNGVELNWTERGRESFHHTSITDRAADVCAFNGENQFSIYTEAPIISFRLPDNASPLQYHICIDGEEKPLKEVCKEDADSFILQFSEEDEKVHLVQLIDWRNVRIVYEYRFVVLNHFSFILDKDLYFDDGTPVKGYVQYNDDVFEIEAVPEADEDTIIINVGGLDYDFRINVPLVRCTNGDVNLLEEHRVIWHEEITKDDFIHISAPRGWNPFLLYEGKTIRELSGHEHYYEFGNTVKAQNYSKDTAGLYLFVKSSDGKYDQRQLLTVAYKPQFSNDLLQLDENNGLFWKPSGRILCGKKNEFMLRIHISPNVDDDYVYSLTMKNERLLRSWDMGPGRFPYEVYLKGKKALFGSEPDQLLYSGALSIGSEAEIRLYNKCICLKMARNCEFYVRGVPNNENIPLAPRSAWLDSFRYQGMSLPPEGDEEVPEFTASLYFIDQGGRKIAFCDDEHRILYELINPVTIWLLNDHLLYMLTVTGDLIQLDKRFGSFVNRKLQLGKLEINERIRTPDLFEYIVTEEVHAV